MSMTECQIRVCPRIVKNPLSQASFRKLSSPRVFGDIHELAAKQPALPIRKGQVAYARSSAELKLLNGFLGRLERFRGPVEFLGQ